MTFQHVICAGGWRLARPLALFAALSAVAACTLPPSGVTQADLVAYEVAVASVGCKLETERQYLPVELQTGLTRDQLIGISQYKLAVEEAVSLDNGGVKLVTGACA